MAKRFLHDVPATIGVVFAIAIRTAVKLTPSTEGGYAAHLSVDWLFVVTSTGVSVTCHCRIVDNNTYTTVRLTEF